MKHILLFVCCLLVIDTQAQTKANDLQRYGLKGRVKEMEQRLYPVTETRNGKTSITDTNIYMVEKYLYTKEGLLTSKIDMKLRRNESGKSVMNTVIMNFSYDKGRIASSEWHGEDAAALGTSSVTWQNDSTYRDKALDNTKNMSTETIHILDENGRNRKVQMIRRDADGKVINNVLTDFYYDNTGAVARQYVYDSLYSITREYKMEILKKDKKGNILNSVYKSVGGLDQPAQVIRYKYEYY
ncbi:MAG: hypothetical protein H0X33_10055 [Taibaiella sp.]|nr:hypothetical protein [Taibaiella sp.]